MNPARSRHGIPATFGSEDSPTPFCLFGGKSQILREKVEQVGKKPATVLMSQAFFISFLITFMKKNYKLFSLLIVSAFLVLTGCTKTTNTNTNSANINVNATTNQNTNTDTVYMYKGNDGKTAIELLKTKFTGVTTTKSGSDEFVNGINNQVAGAKQYWGFYVNDKAATVGASDYITKSTDTIEWRLISY